MPTITSIHAVCRLGDSSKGIPPRPVQQAISNNTKSVYVNGIPVVVVGNSWSKGATSVAGAPTVFIGNIPVVRVGDALSNGDLVNTGSSNVFIGGASSAPPPSGAKTWLDMTLEWLKSTFTWKSTDGT